MELWIIKRVIPHQHSGFVRWEVQATRVCHPFKVQFLTTLQPWIASLCDRAHEQDLTLSMGVERTKNGQEIQHVELAGEHRPSPVAKRGDVIGTAEMFERR